MHSSMAAAKLLSFACFRSQIIQSGSSPKPHYPSMPKYPKGFSKEKLIQGSESKALFSVMGMSCSACAGSVEKAIKRLPGIQEAIVDVLNNRAQVIFFPSFVDEERIRETIEDVGFEAALIEEVISEGNSQVCRVHIKGMTCTTCANSVEASLRGVHGVKKAQVALAM